MAENAPATTKKTTKKKASGPKGPKLSDLILQVFSESKDRKGISLYALKKGLKNKGYDVDKNKSRIRAALRLLVLKGVLVKIKGSYKLAKKTETKKRTIKGRATAPKVKRSTAKPKAKSVDKKKKPAVKKPAAKKAGTPKKKTAKKPRTKSPKKARTVKTKEKKHSGKSVKTVKRMAKPKSTARRSASKKK